ncbi:MAG: hypothetical protein WAN35_11620 [Terracidiphilus sp.]
MSTISSAVVDLQSQWHSLHDLDRAAAVLALTKSGISARNLADRLHLSESLLRHLLCALQALPEDRARARRGEISTNELVRRSKAAGTRRTSPHREAREFERARVALQKCQTICDWLAAENMSGPDGEQIVDEARRLFAKAGQDGRFPPGAAPADMPTEQIIQRCRPAELKDDSVSFIARYAYWLALWTYYSMTDVNVRDQALALALEKQFRR